MDFKIKSCEYEEFDLFCSGQGLLQNVCVQGDEAPGSISHGVNNVFKINFIHCAVLSQIGNPYTYSAYYEGLSREQLIVAELTSLLK